MVGGCEWASEGSDGIGLQRACKGAACGQGSWPGTLESNIESNIGVARALCRA